MAYSLAFLVVLKVVDRPVAQVVVRAELHLAAQILTLATATAGKWVLRSRSERPSNHQNVPSPQIRLPGLARNTRGLARLPGSKFK